MSELNIWNQKVQDNHLVMRWISSIDGLYALVFLCDFLDIRETYVSLVSDNKVYLTSPEMLAGIGFWESG